MNEMKRNLAYALKQCRYYVSIGDTVLARDMARCAELNMIMIRNAETQKLRVRNRRGFVTINLEG